MIVETVNINYKYGDIFKLLPISDIHYDGKGKNSTCDSVKLKRDLAERVDDKTIILTVGDNFGGIIPSDVKRYRKEHDSSSGSDILDESINGLYEIFYPYREKIYGLADGNHEDSILQHCGTNMTKRLIDKLNDGIKKPILYLGYSWLLKINFREPNKSRSRSIVIRGHHGWGGGSRTEGADVTKFAHDVKFWQANLFLYGHVHKLKINDIEEGRMVGNKGWKTDLKRMVVCGTYQRTYAKSTAVTYAEKKGYPPTSIRHPLVYIKPQRDSGVGIEIKT
jgi:hypothetical protein